MQDQGALHTTELNVGLVRLQLGRNVSKTFTELRKQTIGRFIDISLALVRSVNEPQVPVKGSQSITATLPELLEGFYAHRATETSWDICETTLTRC